MRVKSPARYKYITISLISIGNLLQHTETKVDFLQKWKYGVCRQGQYQYLKYLAINQITKGDHVPPSIHPPTRL